MLWLKRIKVAPVKKSLYIGRTFKVSISISYTSLVTRIATSINVLEGQDVTYISTPRTIINEHYLM
jgi:hypothetical protein